MIGKLLCGNRSQRTEKKESELRSAKHSHMFPVRWLMETVNAAAVAAEQEQQIFFLKSANVHLILLISSSTHLISEQQQE